MMVSKCLSGMGPGSPQLDDDQVVGGIDPDHIASNPDGMEHARSGRVEPPMAPLLRTGRARGPNELDPLLRQNLNAIPLAATKMKQTELRIALGRGVG